MIFFEGDRSFNCPCVHANNRNIRRINAEILSFSIKNRWGMLHFYKKKKQMTKNFPKKKLRFPSKIKEMDWVRVSCSEVSGKIQHCPQSSWMKKVLKIILTKFGKIWWKLSLSILGFSNSPKKSKQRQLLGACRNILHWTLLALLAETGKNSLQCTFTFRPWRSKVSADVTDRQKPLCFF